MTSGDPSSAPVVVTFVSTGEQDTDRLGGWLADVLQSGDVVALDGELGAGKTRLVRAVVAALGADDQRASSPTFVLIQRYEGRIPIYHFDAYRIADVDEFLDLGAEEIFAEDGICFIEWAARVAEALPPGILRIEIRATGANTREFLLTGAETRSIAIVRAIQARINAAAQSPGR
ncbi:MAG: tRNA (adenosine(37)-N6)-threonylcarbamoyltransferase complex ATPase subunit type 1 TsaE [Planctomycetaceae bacterium]